MRELTVYYCSQCGYYGFYQLPKNAVCPKCDTNMQMLPMRYQDFMELDCKERDELLGRRIASSSPLIERLVEPYKEYNNREVIGMLISKLQELEMENKKLNDTVEWMHQTIWDLLRRDKGLDEENNSESYCSDKNI